MQKENPSYGPNVDQLNPVDVHCTYKLRVDTFRDSLTRKEHESDQAFLDRTTTFFLEMFEQEKGVYLLPHHFQTHYGFGIRYLNEERELRSQQFYQFFKTLLGSGNNLLISDIYPELVTHDPNTNYSIPYYTQGMSTEECYLTSAALVEALLSTKQPLIISHNPFKDPQCLVSGVVDGGMHCRADFMTHNAKYNGDLLNADYIIDTIKELSSDKAFQELIDQQKIMYSQSNKLNLLTWIYMDHEVAFSSRGLDIYRGLRKKQLGK